MNAGSLEISLAADIARLREDMNKALGLVQRTARGFDDAAAQMRDALGGIGGGLSAAAFGMWIKSAIDFQDQLNDLNKTTDIAVSKLAGISLMSKQTGSDLTGMAQAMNKLTLEMGKAPEKFAKIGITAKSPLEAFGQLSDIFRSIEDPQLRAAVAAEALGKGWASAAPALSEGSSAIADMVARGEELADITKMDAEMADAFNDSMSELQLALMGTASNLAGDMLPLLTELVKSLTDVTASANNTETPFNVLTETLRALIVIGGNVAFVIHGTAVEIGGMAAQAAAFVTGKFSQAAQIGRDMTADAEKRRAAFDGWEQRMMSAGKAARGEAEETKRSAQSISDAVLKSFVDGGAGAKAANKELEEQARLLAELAGLSGSFAADWARLNTIFGKGAITLDQLTAAQAELLAQQPAFKKQQKEQEDAAKKLIDRWTEEKKIVDELYESRMRQFDADAKVIKSAEDMVKQAEFELSIMGMSNVEREKAIALRQLEATGIDKASLKYAELADAMNKVIGDRAAMQKQIDDFQNVWNSIDRTAQQTFTNIFEGGQDAFTKLRDTLKATLLDLLYQMTVRKWVFNLAANVTGASAGAVSGVANSSGLNSIGGLMGNFSGMSMANTAGSMFANATGGGLDALLATNGAYGTAAGAGAGLMSGLSTALPYVGVALVAANALGLFDSKGGPKTEGGADLASTIQQQYNSIAAQLGITNKAIFEAFYSKDPQGDSLTQLRVATLSGGRNIYERLGEENVGRSDAEFGAAVGDATTRAIIAALKDSDLAEEYKQYLNALAADASTTDMQRAIDLIAQRKALDEEWLQASSTEAENLARARERELAAMDPSLRALKERIWAEQKLKEVQQQATEQLRANLATARDGLLAAYDREQDGIQSVIDRTNGYIDSLRRFGQSLATGPLALLSPEAQYNAARASFQRLQGLDPGNEERLANLESVGTAFLEASKSYNASNMQYFADLAAVQVATEQSQLHAKAAVDVNRLILDANRGQLQALGLLNNTTQQGFAAMLAAYKAAQGGAAAGGVVNLDSTLTNGVTTAGGAYIQPAQLETIMAEAQANSTVAQLYQSILGRSPESSGVYDYYNDYTPAQIEAMLRASPEYQAIHGSHADGLWSVPFNGYRAELHAGERVLTASQARGQDASYAEMVTELRGLRAEVARLTTVSANGMQASLGKQDQIINNTGATAKNALLESTRGVMA